MAATAVAPMAASAAAAPRDPALCSKPRNRSIFWPSGPCTARHTKKREWILPTDKDPVWSRSGPPTKEERVQKGERVPALLDARHPARMAGKNIVSLRRDLNNDLGIKS